MPDKVTLKEVAERSGVSVQTASTVLNGSKSNTVVSLETRARILAAAGELRYRRNPLARSLRRGVTNILGFYSGYGTVDARNPFLSEIFGGIQRGCHESRKDLLIHGIFRGDSVEDIYDELTSGKIDGLALYAPAMDALARRLATAALPVVAIADAVSGLTSFVAEDAQGGRQVAAYLAAQGHRRLLYRTPPNDSVSAVRRREGLQQEAETLGMTVETHIEEWRQHGVGAEEARRLLTDAPDRPTAAVCWCDASASAALRFAFEAGLRVPEDLAVVGFDGFALPFPRGVRLTTVAIPWWEIGRRAALLLSEPQGMAESPPEIRFPVELVPGETA